MNAVETIVNASLGSAQTEPERAVLQLILNRGPITQEQIANAEPWLGAHPQDAKQGMETTLRQVREVVRTLRVQRKVPILSDRRGYFFPSRRWQVDEALDRIKGQAQARAASSMETHRKLAEMFAVNTQSTFSLGGEA